jgi:phospholipase/carboxylesterase
VTLVHELREPAGDAEGALVLMHGRGVDQHDLYPLIDMIDPEKRLVGVAPGGPITDIPPGGRHWYVVERVGFPDPPSFLASYEMLSDFFGSLFEERGIGWDRVVLGGFSQGGAMAYALGLGEGRPVPAGILAMSTFVPTVEGWRPDFDSRANLPVFIAHGSLDPIIPVDFGRAARDRLTEAELDVVYHEPRMAHGVDPRLLPEIAEWVAARAAHV